MRCSVRLGRRSVETEREEAAAARLQGQTVAIDQLADPHPFTQCMDNIYLGLIMCKCTYITSQGCCCVVFSRCMTLLPTMISFF